MKSEILLDWKSSEVWNVITSGISPFVGVQYPVFSTCPHLLVWGIISCKVRVRSGFRRRLEGLLSLAISFITIKSGEEILFDNFYPCYIIWYFLSLNKRYFWTCLFILFFFIKYIFNYFSANLCLLITHFFRLNIEIQVYIIPSKKIAHSHIIYHFYFIFVCKHWKDWRQSPWCINWYLSWTINKQIFNAWYVVFDVQKKLFSNWLIKSSKSK